MIEHMHIYPFKLEQEVYKNKFIPRHFKKNERLKLYHKYWVPYYNGMIKVFDIDFINGLEYYFVKYNNNMSGCCSYPLDFDNSYEMLHNYHNIEKDMIINSSKSYSGAEIKAWFIMRQKDLSKETIDGFKGFLVENSYNLISDNKHYFVIDDYTKKQQFQMIINKNK